MKFIGSSIDSEEQIVDKLNVTSYVNTKTKNVNSWAMRATVDHVGSRRAARLVNRARAPVFIEHNKMIIDECRNVPIRHFMGRIFRCSQENY